MQPQQQTIDIEQANYCATLSNLKNAIVEVRFFIDEKPAVDWACNKTTEHLFADVFKTTHAHGF